ncbi:MAG TPA: nuclear transport factor 2 family protein [Microbacteriaceae bacterium]
MPKPMLVPDDALGVITRLLNATNAHDLDELTRCFAPAYVNLTPAHPLRGFIGRGQVHANWEQFFATIPDLQASIVGSVVDGDRVWSEWQMTGTRADGSAHEMAGIIVFTVKGDEIARASLYLEPVERQSGTVDDAVGRQVTGAT